MVRSRLDPPKNPNANPVALTILFTDYGQDFLEWDVNHDGKVIASRPFQGWLWVGVRVMNLRHLKPGRQVIITRDKTETPYAIHYPIAEVIRV